MVNPMHVIDLLIFVYVIYGLKLFVLCLCCVCVCVCGVVFFIVDNGFFLLCCSSNVFIWRTVFESLI